MTPQETLAMARELLTRSDAKAAGVWPRAAALLARQALEQAIDEYWQRRDMGAFAQLPTAPQLICLREYLDDSALAETMSHVWGALTEACHHHPYELAPSLEELDGWIASLHELALA